MTNSLEGRVCCPRKLDAVFTINLWGRIVAHHATAPVSRGSGFERANARFKIQRACWTASRSWARPSSSSFRYSVGGRTIGRILDRMWPDLLLVVSSRRGYKKLRNPSPLFGFGEFVPVAPPA